MRRGGKKVGLILGILLLIEIGVAVMIVQAFAGGFATLTRFDNASFGNEYKQVQAPVEYELNGVGLLTVENRNGKVEVRGEDTTKVTVTVTQVVRRVREEAGMFDQVRYSVSRLGNNIQFDGAVSPGFNDGGNRVDVLIIAPKTIVNNLKTDNGTVIMSNFNSTTAVHSIETDNGSITITQVQAGSINLKTDNGSTTLSDVTGRVKAESDNGRISAQEVTLTEVDFKTDNGRIEINGTIDLKKDGRIETSNGRVDIRLNPITLPRFDVTTDNGGLNLNLPNVSFERNDKKHKTTQGSGFLLKINTDNGSVTVNQK
jgi:DUF4097 and DUF4098 domain-containing protein YvlB